MSDTINANTINAIISKWNNFAVHNSLSQIIKADDSRKESILKRLKETDFDFDKILEEIMKSDFLKGTKQGSNWKVNLDFILCSPKNYLEILEGKYRKHQSN